MPDSSPNPTELAQKIKTGLTGIRQLLLHSPSSLSVESTGPALEQIKVDLLALNTALSPANSDLLHEIQALSHSIQALYRQAFSFYGGLAAESIMNGTWEAASYLPDGDWAQPTSSSTLRVLVEA